MVHVHQGKTHVASPLEIIVYGSKKEKKLNHGGRLPQVPWPFVLRRCCASKPGWEWEFQRLLKFNTLTGSLREDCLLFMV